MPLRIRLLSDLHFEFHADEGKEFVRGLDPRGVDVLVLAGDITKMRLGFDKTLGMFRQRFSCPIIYVEGNHEYHESSRHTVRRGIKDAVSKIPGVHWLDCSTVTIQGQRFVGTTFWFARRAAPRHPLLLSTDQEWQRGVIRTATEKGVQIATYPDFDVIENLDAWCYDEHERSLKFICNVVQEGDIVITHFLPTRHSTPERFKGALSNCFFVSSEMEEWIEARKPALWLHGHTHTSWNYKIGATRIVCNPFGYQSQGELNKDFDENLTVEM